MLTNFAATSRYRNGAGVPIVVRGPSGGGVGGGPFHSLNPESFFLNTPGLKMVEPSTAYDAKGLLKAAIRDDDPVLYFEHKYPLSPHQGRGARRGLHRPASARRRSGARGRDLSIITFGAMVHTALDAAAQLEAGRRARGGPRPAQPRAARSRGDPDLGVEDQPRAAALRGDAAPAASAASWRRSSRRRRSSISTLPIIRDRLGGRARPLRAAARGRVPAERREGGRAAQRDLVELLSQSPQHGHQCRDAPDGRIDCRRHHRPLDQEGRRERSIATSRCSRSRPTRSTPRSRRRAPAC